MGINLKETIIRNRSIILFFILLTIFRLFLITKGHRFDLDERRYLSALYVWDELLHGRFLDAIGCFFTVQGRPGFVLVNLIPAGLQLILVHFNLISHSDLHFFDVVSLFNVLICLTSGIIFYKILLLLLNDRAIATAGTIFYSLLVNTNVYIRHLFPYDYSLLLFFIVLFLILRQKNINQIDDRTAAICGIISALGALVYPGYYALAFILFFFLTTSVHFKPRVIILYGIGFLGTLLFFEFMARMVGASYFFDCKALSATVNHGSFAEGFLFISRYIKEVEGLIGVLLLFLCLIYFIYFLPKDKTPLKWLLVMTALMYSLHAILGLVFLKMVFYGRCLHMYFPFMVLAAVKVLTFIPKQRIKTVVTGILIACSVLSFIPSAYTYINLSYPGDVFFKYFSHVPKNKILWVESDKFADPNIYKNYSVVSVNIKSYFDVNEGPVKFHPPSNMTLQVAEPHPLNFLSYTFENYTPEERGLIKERKYRMMIYVDSELKYLIDNKLLDNDNISLGTFLNKVGSARI